MITAIVTLLGGVRATVFAGLFLAAALFAGTQSLRLDHAKADLLARRAEADAVLATAVQNAREKESAIAAAAADAAALYEKGKTDAKASTDALFANLLVSNVRMRRTWQCPATTGVPAVAAPAGEPDAAAADRAASASAIVRAAANCDAQVIALQALVRADRGLP